MPMISRRHLLKIFGSIVATFCFSPRMILALNSSAEEQAIKFRWLVPEVHLETLRKELVYEGEVLPGKDTKGVLVYIIVGTATAFYISKAILSLRREIVEGGVLIDTRSEPILIETNKSLPAGYIVVVTSEGTQIYYRDEVPDLIPILKSIPK